MLTTFKYIYSKCIYFEHTGTMLLLICADFEHTVLTETTGTVTDCEM